MAKQQESSEAVERCIKALARLQRWAIGGDCSVDPVAAIKYLLETFTDAYSLAVDWNQWAAVQQGVETIGGVTCESAHETAMTLVQRTLDAVANDLGTKVLGPYPAHPDGTGRWTAEIPGVSSLEPRQDHQRLQTTIRNTLDFDVGRLLALVRKEHALAIDKTAAKPDATKPTTKPHHGDGNGGPVDQQEVPREARITIHNYHDHSISIQGDLQGSNVATGGAKITGSSAGYNSTEELVEALNALTTLIHSTTKCHEDVVRGAIEVLIRAAGDPSVPATEVERAASVVASSSPTFKQRLGDIAGRLGISLTGAAIFQGIKTALGIH